MSKEYSEIELKKLTEKNLKELREGVRVIDKDTKRIFEKYKGQMQPMIEEEGDSKSALDGVNTVDVNHEKILEIINSGNKIMEANLFMKLKASKHSLMSQKDLINQKVNFIFSGTPEQLDIIQTRVAEVTEEAISNATLEELNPFFLFDGEYVGLNFSEVLEDKENLEGIKDFLLYLKSVDDTSKEIDMHIKEIDDVCQQFSADILESSKSIYEWDNYIYELFKAKLADENTGEEERERLQRIIDVKDAAITLEPIIEYVKGEIDLGRKRSLLNAYNTRFQDTLNKAEKYASERKFHVYFNMYGDMEEIFGFPKYKNFFIYVYARYIRYNIEYFKKIDNAYIAQVCQNLIMLKRDELPEPKKTTFINAIKHIYELLLVD